MSALLFAFLGLPIAVPVHVTLRSSASLNCAGVVRAEQGHVTTAAAATSTLVDGNAALELPEAGHWQISLQSDACWAAPASVDLAAGATKLPDLELRTWPRGELSGSVSVPRGNREPDRVRLELRSATLRGRSLKPEPLGTIACPVVERQWRCEAPIAALDVRMNADGFAPAYFWNIEFEKAQATLPATLLQPGASLSGWVEDRKGEAVGSAEIRLMPQSLTRTSARTSGLSDKAATVHSNGRGFFQFGSLAPGDYSIVARGPEGAASGAVEVTVRDGRESLLPDPVVVEPSATVIVQVTPSLAPDRQPWTLRLSRYFVADGALEPRATGRANELGTWRVEGVERGAYNIEVLDTAGSVVARLNEKVDRDTNALEIQVGNVRVEGRVRFGTEPVAAELKFVSAEANVRMRAEKDGTFAGWLPNEGSWQVTISPKDTIQFVYRRVRVRVPSDDTTATVDLDLPGGRIEGVVVDEQGALMPKADVRVLKGSDILAITGTDSEGRFVVRGMEPGPVMVFAETEELFSEYQHCTISEVPGDKETIVVRAPVDVKGKLLHPSGAPAVGALIRYFRNDLLFTAVSGPTGEFSLTLSAESRSADVIVITPRRTIVVDRVQLGREKPVIVVPDNPAEVRITPRRGSNFPRISRNGGRLLSVALLLAPMEGLEPPREFANGAITLQVAPGMYNVCYSHSPDGDCVEVAARPGEITRVVSPAAGGGK
jgi:hypothetical protein